MLKSLKKGFVAVEFLIVAALVAGLGVTLFAFNNYQGLVSHASEEVKLSVFSAVDDSDIANEENFKVENSHSEVWLGTGGDVSGSYFGARMKGDFIPKNARIHSATFKFKQPKDSWIWMSFRGKVEDSQNPSTFSNSNKISSRPLLSPETKYGANEKWNAGQTYTFDFTSSVQELVNKYDTDTIALVFKGGSSKFGRKYIYLRGQSEKPVLEVQYSVSSSTSPVPSATSSASPTPSPSPSPSATVTATPSPTPSPTSSPTVSPFPTGATIQGGAATGGLGLGGPTDQELGFNLTKFNELKTRAAAGEFNRPCSASEHDPYKWHSLVNEQAKCHYNHHHGDDPHYVEDVFGAPGAWFNNPGQSISYPWQTFKTKVTDPRTITAEQAGALNGGMENQTKHEGYIWIVRRNQPCSTPSGGYCVKDFRVLIHAMGMHDVSTRWHSFSAEMNLCANMADPSTCGTYRTGGWIDHGPLLTMIPKLDGEGRDMAQCGEGLSNEEKHIALPVDSHFGPLPKGSIGGSNMLLNDVFRCHPILSNRTVARGPELRLRTDQPMAEWWTHGSTDFRFQFRINDPIGNVYETFPGSGVLQNHMFCTEARDGNGVGLGYALDPNCRWTQSIISLRLQYVIPLNSYWHSGFVTQGVINMPLGTRYVTRFGGIASGCTGPGLDCVPLELNKVKLVPDQIGYLHTPVVDHCPGCRQMYSHDMTPVGTPSWVRWFYTK